MEKPKRWSGYIRARTSELALPSTRAVSDPLADWAVRSIRLDGRPFRFENHEYLRAIYDDTAQHIVLSKAAQIGGTTWAVLKSLHACVMGLNVMYFFPTRTDVLDFSKSRVGPLLAENQFLSKLMHNTDTAGLKRIGDAYLYLRGMQSTVGMKSVPADMLVFDELDEAAPEAKAMAKERVAHSDYKRVIELSNPSLPEYGIDESYQRSDQRHWTIKCEGCGRWTALEKEFPVQAGQEVRIIRPRDDGTFYRACPKCDHELDIDRGEWIADFPDKRIHGYRISQLFSPKVDPGEILEEYRMTRFLDRFYNLKIGIPWADLARRLDVSSVLSLCGDVPMPDHANNSKTWRSMGVDTGKALHVVVLESDFQDESLSRVIHIGTYHDFSELDEVMKRYDVGSCVIDGLPETHATRQFAMRHPGKVFMCFFNESQRGEPGWDQDTLRVSVHRTDALDISRAAIREKQVVLPREEPIVREFAKHLCCDAKVLDENEETGVKKYRYIRTGENHFSMAFTYGILACQANSSWRAFSSYMQWVRKRGTPWL